MRDLRALPDKGPPSLCAIGAAVAAIGSIGSAIGGAVGAVGGALGGIGGTLGTVSSVVGAVNGVRSILGGTGSNTAANDITGATNANNALQAQIYQANSQNLSPFINTGVGALGRLDASQQPGFDWNAFLAGDPAAQFQIEQGTNVIDRSAAAAGSLDSGGTLKALDRFGQGVATDEINNWWNRNSQLAQFGLSGANALAGVGTNYANAVGQNNLTSAAAQGNAALVNASNANNLFSQGINALAAQGGFNSTNPFAGAIPISPSTADFGPTVAPAPIQTSVPGLTTFAPPSF